MGRLVRIINGDIALAYRYIATPEYILHVADYAAGATPPHGWEYHPEDLTIDDFAPLWKQPTGAQDAYALGFIVQYNGLRWRSLINGNVWEPGVSGWSDADSEIPSWIQPTGAHDSYVKDAVVKHNGQLWKSVLDANVWEPGVAEWRKTSLVVPGEPIGPQEWIQPTGAPDAYALNDIVTHNGYTWRSDYAANVWEPGVFGWTQI